MQDPDAFLTRTIVGSPFSALLGHRLGPEDAAAAGLQVDLRSGHARLAQGYDDHLALFSADAPPDGRPHRRPGRWRRRLERHALTLAITGLAVGVLGGVVGALAASGTLRWP